MGTATETAGKGIALNFATILAALGASLCCILPVAVAILGVGSAALGAKLEPWRPWFIVLTVGLFGFAFYEVYRPRECAPGEDCGAPTRRRRHRALLWVVATASLLLITFPYYVRWIL